MILAIVGVVSAADVESRCEQGDRWAEGGPWIMFPGTPGAHIMINPPR
ncbi:MAG: hypothetical protein AB8H79_02565 [Myxococcota bacterium]